MTTDAYTMDLRLCDDAGMVSHEHPGDPGHGSYLDRINSLRSRTGPLGEHKPVEEPFTCTGSAHLAGEHIRCTSPAHAAPSPVAFTVGAAPAIGLLSPAGSVFASINGIWPPQMQAPQGWECPRCHGVMAPAMIVCPYCAPRRTTESGTSSPPRARPENTCGAS